MYCFVSDIFETSGIFRQIRLCSYSCRHTADWMQDTAHDTSRDTIGLSFSYPLVGLVVRRPPRERKIPRSIPACVGIFSGSSHTSDIQIGTPVTTLPGSWRYRVSAGTGRTGVSILWLGEMEVWSATSNSVWQHVKLSEQIRPRDTLACCWDVKQASNQQTLSFCCSMFVEHPDVAKLEVEAADQTCHFTLLQ